ncbi:MAG TPA: fructosamine kinase family protein [Nocardioidaceae bacterium]
MGAIASRAESLLGAAVVATTAVAGGDICTSTRLRLSDGSSALVKTRANAPADFFPAEARGLRWLGEAGGVDVPEVLAAEQDCLILSWVEVGRPSAEAAERFGRALAVTHRAGAPQLGGDQDGYIGTLPLPNRTAPTWPEFFATRRLLPYLKLARDRGSVSAEDAAAVEGVVRRITELAGPEEPPARLHGDLWSGNVLWGQDGRTWLVDPAAYGGHRETDLAMLALFGLPQLPRVLDAYQEEAPLADGWEDRVGLHQLFPLLVHAALFGGGYGARAGQAARALL